MYNTIKKIIVGCISILGITTLTWIALFLNPQWSYAHQTNYDYVTVFHNHDLPVGTEQVINDAIEILKDSELFMDETHIQLCLNDDDQLYPHLHPLVGAPYAYAALDKTIIKNCKLDFDNNVLVTQWKVNNNEERKFDLTRSLAHEFAHNLQFAQNFSYVIKSTMGNRNWKLEGHAEYIGRGFRNDGKLKEKVTFFLEEERKDRNGIPVFDLKDGTKQILSYYKYALVVQYLFDIKGMDYMKLCDEPRQLDTLYEEMIIWSRG